MDVPFSFLFEHAAYAHWVVFSLLMLAGLNIPISEDLLIIISGVIASTAPTASLWKLFLGIFLGAYISDWIPYWLGRRFGPNLWKLKWFSRMIKPERLLQVKDYYKRYGVLTLLVGRFIPFGVRNCLFCTAGMGAMSFTKFLIADGIACFLSNATLFTISYIFSKNIDLLIERLNLVHLILFFMFLIAVIGIVWYRRINLKRRRAAEK